MEETVYDVKRPPSPYRNPKYAKVKSRINTNLDSKGRLQKRQKPTCTHESQPLFETFGQIATQQTIQEANEELAKEREPDTGAA